MYNILLQVFEDGQLTAKRAFNPDFLNRLDETILFTSLNDEDLLKIIHLLVDQINRNLVAKQIKIHLTDEVARYLPPDRERQIERGGRGHGGCGRVGFAGDATVHVHIGVWNEWAFIVRRLSSEPARAAYPDRSPTAT